MKTICLNDKNEGPNITIVKTEEGLRLAFVKFVLWLSAKQYKHCSVSFDTINSSISIGTLYTISMLKRNGSSKVVMYVDANKGIHVSKNYEELFKSIFNSVESE